MNGIFKQLSLWVVFLIIVVLLLTTLNKGQTPKGQFGPEEFTAQLEQGNVKRIQISMGGEKGIYTVKGELIQEVDGRKSFSFNSLEKYANEYYEKAMEKGIPADVDKESSGILVSILINIVPLILIVAVFWFFMFRQMQGGSNKALSFGKSRARLVNHSDKVVTFDDVAGVDEAKEELQEIIEFLKEPKKFSRLGGKIPKGVLLVGPPGSGKTLLARAVAGEAHVPFFSISGSDFVEMFVGVGASRVRDLFQQGQKHAPCIIFIDEIDAVGRQRGAGLGGGHDEREQTLNQLLVEMDGFNTSEGVILMAATNRPDVLDRALLRPGRFDRQIVVANPDIKGREAILGIHIRNNGVPCDQTVSVNTLARGTSGFSGADLANMVNEAALLAARRNQDKVTAQDFEDAKDRVLMGPERRSLVLSAKEKKNTAFHEAGHVIVGRLLPHADPVHKVTIIPRGPALGVTSMIPLEDRYSYSKEYCLAALRMMMGGRAAEDVMFGQFSSGAAGDLKSATELAHRMVCQWGMSEMGPISFGSNTEVFLGRDFMRERDFSEETASAIDKAIHKLLEDAYGDAKKMLIEHKNILVALSEELYERETLDAEEIDDLFRKHGLGHLLPVKKESPPGTPPKGIEVAPDKKAAREPEVGGGLGPGDMVPGPA
ncbi:MAG: ATP-dependent metallopeptidase FtsH/Yme1/Tma family protein [Candidatus Hydrogenedentes bacterium]|nr:ATP-dependent metallopeptidase FtsH/Yme1/Tma family protein [Candidatus Hydrogenedentota bacterium]